MTDPLWTRWPSLPWVLRSAVCLLTLLLLHSAALAEKRVALLIGNEAYASVIGRLANPRNDVALLEQALKGLGFEVVTVPDAGLGALHQAINTYARRAQAAGPSAVGFFYYSGHGASDGTTNYLIPVDVKTTETGELWDQSLRLTEITRKLKTEASNATHFVVFDACRNTLKLTQPGSRAVVQSKGFVPVAQENGMLIAYATAEGELASDVGSGAGPYAKVLVEEVVKPGIEAVTMFRNVQRRVRAAIRQEPYLGFSALGDVYLAGKGEQLTATPMASQSGSSTAEREWQQYGKDTKDIRLLEAFKEKHKGDPVYARLADVRIEELKKQNAKSETSGPSWREKITESTPPAQPALSPIAPPDSKAAPSPPGSPLIGRPFTEEAKRLAPIAAPPVPTAADKLPLDKLKAQAGFKIELYAAGVPNARTLRIGDKGTVFISSRIQDKIHAIVEKGGEREVKVIASGLHRPNGIVLHKGTLYIAELHQISKIEKIEDNLDNPPKPTPVLVDLPKDEAHGWKYLTVGPDEKLYFQVGAPCNICMPSERHAKIYRVGLDGRGLEVYATASVRLLGWTGIPP